MSLSQHIRRRSTESNTSSTRNTNINTNRQDMSLLLDMYERLYTQHIDQINQNLNALNDIRRAMDSVKENILNSSMNSSNGRYRFNNPGRRTESRTQARTDTHIPQQVPSIPPTRNINIQPIQFSSTLTPPSSLFRPVYNNREPRNRVNPLEEFDLNMELFGNFLNSTVVVRPTQEQIRAASTVRIFSDIPNPLNTTCPICREYFTPDEEVTQLFCGHIFSTSDINRWFESHVRCPMCSVDIRELPNREVPRSRHDISTSFDQLNLDLDLETRDFGQGSQREAQEPQQQTETERPETPAPEPSLLRTQISEALTTNLFNILLGDNTTERLNHTGWRYAGSDASGSLIMETYILPIQQRRQT